MPQIAADAARIAFLDALAGGESEPPAPHRQGYDVLCGGGRFRGFEAFPIWNGVEGPAGRSHAAGRYQFEPATWEESRRRLRLSDFGPAAQDAAAWDLARRVYGHMTRRDLALDLSHSTVGYFVEALSSTWPSVNHAFLSRLVLALHRAAAAA